jgi:NitT/TauT family transport system ATP-binding protein
LYINVNDVFKQFRQNKGNNITVLDGINLIIEKSEFICLLGPSGCGKTTLLNLIAGFDKPTKGKIYIDDKEVTAPSPKYITIFQNYGLLPWRTVEKNVELGLEQKKISKEERKKIASEYLELVGLSNFKGQHPHQISGGMKQRVAIARALAADPEVIFMDEPFGALDAITRMKLQDDISQIWSEKKKTIIFVTHDIDEAVFLSDRIVIMSPYPGKIKSIIKVDLARKRDRTSTDFIVIRDKVFTELEMKEKDNTEYYI